MHVWAIARARATIGGPSFDSRTPSRNALFQRSTTLSRGAADARLATIAEAGTPDRSSAAPPAAAAVRKSRRDTARFNAMAPRSTSFEGRWNSGFIARLRRWAVGGTEGGGRHGAPPSLARGCPT